MVSFFGAGDHDPEAITAMAAAYVAAMLELGIGDGNDPQAEAIAKAIISAIATGERDPEKLKARAIRALAMRKPDAF